MSNKKEYSDYIVLEEKMRFPYQKALDQPGQRGFVQRGFNSEDEAKKWLATRTGWAGGFLFFPSKDGRNAEDDSRDKSC